MILKYKQDAEFFTPEKCYINELINLDEDEGCSIARARVKAGITTQLHALKWTTERYVILEGVGKVEIDGREPTLVNPNDVVYIRADQSQRITNTGNQDLVFLVVCTPRFKSECYITLEEPDTK